MEENNMGQGIFTIEAGHPGGIIPIRANSVLTASYVASGVVDMSFANSVFVLMAIGTAQAGKTANIKFQWSMDEAFTLVAFEKSITDGAASGGEQPQTTDEIRLDMSMAATTSPEIRRFNRLGKFFRVM